jgi:predicted O-linked N-acetylglucosamine transferase (SPINDLY family)
MTSLRDCLEEATAEAAAGRIDRAIAAYRRAIALSPARSDLRYNLGVLLAGQDDFAAAERAFIEARPLRPDWPALPLALGHLCYRQRRYTEAQARFEQAVALAPDSVEALGNLAAALSAQRRFELALPHLERARSLAPADEDVWFALRGGQVALGRDEEAERDFAAFAREAKPSARLVAAGFDTAMLGGDDEGVAEYLQQALAWPYEPKDAALVAGMMARLQYLDVPRTTIRALYRTYNRLQQSNRGDLPPLAPRREAHAGPLRVGYLSADFRDHVIGRLLLSTFEQHDRARMTIHGYSLTPPENEDAMTARFRSGMDSFVALAGLDDLAAARRIALDRPDVLVDLMALSALARPTILLYKPAPVIVTHLGYHGCVGLEQVDFKLTDRHADLPDAAAYQIETPLPLSTCALPVRRVVPQGVALQRGPLGIAADAIVFATFVGPVKLSARGLALWREILERVPGSRLAFSPYEDNDKPRLLRRLARGGIAADRAVFLPSTWDEAKDRMRYAVIDIALDTMPYTGGDTTAAALDMGIPVVTRCGERHAERMSYSILAHLGVTATVAHTDAEYVAIACRLATDPAWRAEVSATIRRQFATVPLADPGHYARCLEDALQRAATARAGGAP